MLDPVPQPSILDHRKLLLYAIAALTALFFLQDFLRAVVPHRIEVSGSTINIYGLMILVSLGLVFYIMFKKVLAQTPAISVFYLVIMACLVVLFSELIYQSYVMASSGSEVTTNDRIVFFLIQILLQPIVSLVVSVPLAIELRYKNSLYGTIAFIVLAGIGWYLVVYLKLLNDIIP